jgi:hypothetical protein
VTCLARFRDFITLLLGGGGVDKHDEVDMTVPMAVNGIGRRPLFLVMIMNKYTTGRNENEQYYYQPYNRDGVV